MKYSVVKSTVRGGVTRYMRANQCGYTFAKARIDALRRKYPKVDEDLANDACLERLVRFERRHPRAFSRAIEGNVHRAALESGISSGALRVEYSRLTALALRLNRPQAAMIQQVMKIAAEKGPLAPSRAGRPRKVS